MSSQQTGSCECGGCRERFNSLSAFDLHRHGAYGVDRHCRQPSEMIAIGMSRNDHGLWIERRRGEVRQKRGPAAQGARSAVALTHGAGL